MAIKKRATVSAEKKTDDVVLVHGRSEDGTALAVIRKQGDSISSGIVRVAEEGKPIVGELVRLRPRDDMPLVCDVEVLHEGRESPRTPESHATDRHGPSRAATVAYRHGWEAIWGDTDPTPAAVPAKPRERPN